MSKPRSRVAACSIAIFCCLVSLFVSPPASAGGNASITLTKTVDSATVTPVLSVGLKADRATALPGDKVGYTATVTNSAAMMTLTGRYTATSTAGVSGTVVSWYDDIEYVDKASNTWQTLAVTSGAQDGYTPAEPGPTGPPLTVKLTGQLGDGVTYGDRVVGTTIASGATASWSYTASVQLTQEQAKQLADPAQVGGFRNVVHFEMSPRTGPQPYIDRASFTNPLLAAGAPPATGVEVTFTLPDGSTTTVGPGLVAGLASIAPGASVDVPASYVVPVLDPKGDGEPDADYLARLTKADGAQLKATARASSDFGPASSVTSAPVNTIEQVPVLTVKKTGPVAAVAGDKVTYDITGTNTGSAAAAGIAVTDRVGKDTTDVDFPATLDPGADATGKAGYTVPGDRDAGDLTDTASATWADGNGNTYGPVSDSFTTTVTPSALQPISTGLVTGRFFPESTAGTGFVAKPGDTPAFGQQFPNIAFDPPAGVVPHDITGTGPTTRPFRDVTEDVNGNAIGALPAQGNGHQAGVGDMNSFDAVFTGTFHVTQPGDVTLKLTYDTDVILGVGGAATRVNGVLENPPASGTTGFEGYPVLAADNRGLSRTQPAGENITVHFPTAGSYPYELDYAERRGNPLSLVMQTVSFTQDTSPISVYVGYADGLRAGGTAFPFPWRGSANVDFEGCQGSCSFDSGAIRIDNSGTTPVTLDHFSTDFAGCHLAIWPDNLTLQPGRIMLFAQEANGADSGCYPTHGTFDTSDLPYAGNCTPSGVIPRINVTIDGTTTTYTDDTQVLNTKGIDPPSCGKGNESQPWSRIGGGGVGVDTPLPPATFLRINAAGQTGGDTSGGQAVTNSVGSEQTVAVSALDAAGNPEAGLPVDLTVAGANAQHVSGTTGKDGTATLSYVGTAAGSDTLEATADPGGLHTVSNQFTVTWALPPGTVQNPIDPGSYLPAPAPAITAITPDDGTRVTAPVAIKATIAPPTGEDITTWKVTYQELDPGPVITLAQGTGTPPATLATLDPSVLANGNYRLDVTATSSGGGVQTQSTTVAVDGSLKLGRFTTAVQDLDVPVNGFDMRVLRSYDTLDRDRVGDFGYGWRVSLSNFGISPNRALGAGGWSQHARYCAWGLCMMDFTTSTPHYVTVTFPDGHDEIFDFTPTGGTNVFWDGTAAFTARPGTGNNDTLEANGDQDVSYTGDGNLYAGLSGTGGLYNPTRFTLTQRDGTQLVLDTNTGLVSETKPTGATLTVTSDGVHSSDGPGITFDRDTQGRITDLHGPSGEHLHYTYDNAGDLTDVTDDTGGHATYAYNIDHAITSIGTSTVGTPLRTITYTADGRVATIANGNEPPVQVDTDLAARTETLTDAAGRLTTMLSFDELGDLVRKDETADGKTLTWKYAYDPVGHLTDSTLSGGGQVHATYDGNGDLTQLTDADGHTTDYHYDASTGLLQSVGPDGKPATATYTYNAGGQLTHEGRADGTGYDYVYTNGLMTTATDPSGRALNLTYDENDHIKTVTDSAGRTTDYTSDASGNVTAATDNAGDTIHYGYDGFGRLTDIIDALGHDQKTVYDDAGRVHQQIDGDGNSITFTYDPSGRLSTRLDRNGDTTTYTYDSDGRLASEKTPFGTTTYGYDGFGRLVSADNPDAKLGFTWDSDSHLQTASTAPTTSSDQPSSTLTYTYTTGGDVTGVTGAGSTTGYGYSDGLLKTITDSAAGGFAITYDGLDRPHTITSPNGLVDTLSWNNSDQLSSRTTAVAGQTITSVANDYDPTGRLRDYTTGEGQTTLGYDPAGRLSSVARPAGAVEPRETFTYDTAGNRTSTNGSDPAITSVDNADRLTADQNYTYTYDHEGNLLSKTSRATGALTTYTWDTDHQLVKVVLPNGGTVAYKYDALGRRVEVNDQGTITRYVYDGLNPRAEYDATNKLTADYVNPPGLDNTLAMVRGGRPYYYSRDTIGSATALTNAAGDVVARYHYTAYGTPVGTAGGPANPSTYAGRQYDDSTGLYYSRARYYDPDTGRFLSEDPLPSANPYPYTDDNPVSRVDPLGTDTVGYAILTNAEADAEVTITEFGEDVGIDELSAMARGLAKEFWDRYAFEHRTLAVARYLDSEGELQQVWAASGGNYDNAMLRYFEENGVRYIDVAKGEHAEEALVRFLGSQDSLPNEIGSSRQVCEKVCQPLLRGLGYVIRNTVKVPRGF